MTGPVLFSEAMEARTLLSSAVIGHIDGGLASRHNPAAIHAGITHAARHRGHKASRASSSSAVIGELSPSGPFSFTFGVFVLSGTLDGSTHAVTAVLIGPGFQFDITGTFDPVTRHLVGTISGDRTSLAVDGTLVGTNSVKGSLEGTLFGTAISFNGTVPLT
jgi:hypothetical protein